MLFDLAALVVGAAEDDKLKLTLISNALFWDELLLFQTLFALLSTAKRELKSVRWKSLLSELNWSDIQDRELESSESFMGAESQRRSY